MKVVESDTIVLITPKQLKETNLIFAEHSKLLKETELLSIQLHNIEEENNLLLKTDSLRLLQINNYKNLSQEYDNQIIKLNKVIEKKNKATLAWQIGGISVSVGLVLWLLLK